MSALDEMVTPRSGASVGDTFIYSVPSEVARAAPAELARLQAIKKAAKNVIGKRDTSDSLFMKAIDVLAAALKQEST